MFVCEGAHVCMSERGSLIHTLMEKKNENHCTSVILSNKNLKDCEQIEAHISPERKVPGGYCMRVCDVFMRVCACLLHDIKWVSLVMNDREA